jgi:hypothetical protein
VPLRIVALQPDLARDATPPTRKPCVPVNPETRTERGTLMKGVKRRGQEARRPPVCAEVLPHASAARGVLRVHTWDRRLRGVCLLEFRRDERVE